VSLLNEAGIDARTIADRIEHTDTAFTITRYTHVFEDQRKAVAVPLLSLLTKSQETLVSSPTMLSLLPSSNTVN
jgi:hypothetical protein